MNSRRTFLLLLAIVIVACGISLVVKIRFWPDTASARSDVSKVTLPGERGRSPAVHPREPFHTSAPLGGDEQADLNSALETLRSGDLSSRCDAVEAILAGKCRSPAILDALRKLAADLAADGPHSRVTRSMLLLAASHGPEGDILVRDMMRMSSEWGWFPYDDVHEAYQSLPLSNPVAAELMSSFENRFPPRGYPWSLGGAIMSTCDDSTRDRFMDSVLTATDENANYFGWAILAYDEHWISRLPEMAPSESCRFGDFLNTPVTGPIAVAAYQRIQSNSESVASWIRSGMESSDEKFRDKVIDVASRSCVQQILRTHLDLLSKIEVARKERCEESGIPYKPLEVSEATASGGANPK